MRSRHRWKAKRRLFFARSTLSNQQKQMCFDDFSFSGFDRSKRRNHISFFRTVSTDNSKSKPSISESRQLWEEMSPDTRELARSIICQYTTSNADRNFHDNNVFDAEATRKDRIQTIMHPRVAISRAITLVESKHPFKKRQGDILLTYLLLSSPSRGIQNERTKSRNNSILPTSLPTQTLRVGFAGPPGVGKSSIMEAFGMNLLARDPKLKLAVVCIDPSSTSSTGGSIPGGSILADKTRMIQLSRQVDRALVRPSCNSGVLGGLAAYTDDVVRLLGCAGYPLVLVETVGLGQSETEVAHSVDVLVLLVSPSGGDELQGVKKGIVEVANILAVTKNDGDLEAAADRTAADYRSALRVLYHSNDNKKRWIPPVVKTSSITQCGLDDLWQSILKYEQHLLKTGDWHIQRQKQAKYWMWKHFSCQIQNKLREEAKFDAKAQILEQHVLQGLLTPRVAAQKLKDYFFGGVK